MVKLNRIYTRGGDQGRTSLGDGSRVAKHALRVDAYGNVDETNATIGLARLQTEGAMDEALARIQNDLFDLGADLCRPEDGTDKHLRIAASQVERLEVEIDELNADLPSLASFVLPGGSPTSSFLHLARTVARRAERSVVELAEQESVNPAALQYLNRLSDYLFVLSRAVNDRGRQDVLWVPGANR